ncbi:MAG: regulatory iron-sulfur-containing complex subunit RicT [Humidesulfovibrio sp.]|nr:regulatory iron-sulfur-containing complex subunit RicT [Humidesulfovibrio sp.]
MSQILGIKFSDHGPVCYFTSGLHVLRTGQSVLVETDQGLALGQVATIAAPDGAAVDMGQPATDQQPEALSEAPAPEASQATVPSQPAPFEDSFGSADWDVVLSDASVQPADTEFMNAESLIAQSTQPDGETGPVTLFVSDQASVQPVPHSLAGLQAIHRLATEADLETHAENRRLARRAFSFCRGCIHSQNLDMKLVDVEVLHDRSKLIFFFTAPNRIDFRELIKSLVREFHTRIELRQIGVRHETQMIGAIGNCGQVCCCRRFLRKFAPVTIKMAKEQNLFLNPAKISGICGRLLCCLSYEQKGYEEFHKQCPKIGKRVQTPLGSVKVLRANFFKKSISVWVEDVGEREFTLEEWKEMLNRQPGDAPPEAPAQEAQPRQGSGRSRPSTGRPSRSERAPRPDKGERTERPARAERPERTERPEQAERGVAQAVSAPAEAGEVRPESGEGAGRERSRPRRKRRKGKGPKPA